jgi:hypothetical protein
MHMSLPVFTASRVRARIRSASSSPVVVETPGGMFLAKLRGAGQGVSALVAEVIVAELAERLGLPVPERVLLELPAELPSDDRNDELAQLLELSVGLNVGFRYLPGATLPRPEELARLPDDFALRVLWLDGWVMNPDRTRHNPNILLWKRQPWLIDHGAALTFQHDWAHVSEASPREARSLAEHVFAERLARLPQKDEELSRSMSRAVVGAALARVPDAFLEDLLPAEEPQRRRALYAAFLWKRLVPPRPFVPHEQQLE